MTRVPILIDTDPGQDDAVMLMLAMLSPELEIVAVTAVGGNVPLARTEANARRICELMGRRDLVVAAGCDRPLVRELVTILVFRRIRLLIRVSQASSEKSKIP